MSTKKQVLLVMVFGVFLFGVTPTWAQGQAAGGTCGDGTLDPPSEECDDGNTNFGDGCSPVCRFEPTEPLHFLVDQLSLATFRRNMVELSTIPSSPGSPTPSRHWSLPGNDAAVELLKTKLESYGYTNVTLDPYFFEGKNMNNVYATKVGTVDPTQMYIISGHMDSINFNNTPSSFGNAPGYDDDGSGTSLTLELARVFAKTQTDISVRFIFWNNEETGLNGSQAYVANHRALQGTPAEPTWAGVIQHDMILFDRSDSPDADVEYQARNDFGGKAIDLANFVGGAMSRYGTMPAEVSDDMDFTDSKSFWDDAPSISVRENRRVQGIGNGTNPQWHEPTDKASTYTFADHVFGFNIVKMTGGAVAELVNAVADCDMNGVPDTDDITAGATDANGDGVPDVCQDCNENLTLDPTEIADGSVSDCNGNGVPDSCDISSGFSDDIDALGVPDECQSPEEENKDFRKNRYLSFRPNNAGSNVAMQIQLLTPDRKCIRWEGPCETSDDCIVGDTCVAVPTVFLNKWVDTPFDPSCQNDDGTPTGDPCEGVDFVSRLVDEAVFRVWPEPLIHVGDCEVVPVSKYQVRTTHDGVVFSDPIQLATIAKPEGKFWADLVGNALLRCSGDRVTPCTPKTVSTDCPAGDVCGIWTGPNGLVNVNDVNAFLKFFTGKPAPHMTAVDIAREVPNFIANATDLQLILLGFRGVEYPPPGFPTHVCVGGVDAGQLCSATVEPPDCPGGSCTGFTASDCP